MARSINIKLEKLTTPIIQGGMGVGISLGNLAGSVMAEGGMGVISLAHPGYRKEDFMKNPFKANEQAVHEEVKKARELSQEKGLLAVNAMCAINRYDEYVKVALDAGVDAIISGAGLPLSLPAITKDYDVLIAPIISSAKACELLLKSWDRHYNCTADFIVIEGPEAGGHLGFKPEELFEHQAKDVYTLLEEVKPVVHYYEEKYDCIIPIFLAGGMNTKEKIDQAIRLGATGAQVATSFIPTIECDADTQFKEMFLHHPSKELTLIKSPVGYYGRVLVNPLTKKLEEGRVKPNFCLKCIKPCDFNTTPFCISEALIEAAKGNVIDGLVFSGATIKDLDKLRTVKEVIDELMGGQR
ncbi:NAD(P)H-dependent flavin oxidoreductase [Anaerorhabdus sp.]|uniref:NAD(P)H-dependent flavin oxidoreductase n=1 Tax=Anaerorhabdus sp. TaxID=1872524 RepID=UPI002FC67BCF